MGRMATHTGQLVTWDQALSSDFQFVADIDNTTSDTPPPSTTPRQPLPLPSAGVDERILIRRSPRTRAGSRVLVPRLCLATP